MKYFALISLTLILPIFVHAQSEEIQGLNVQGKNQTYFGTPDTGVSLLVYSGDRNLLATLTIPGSQEVAIISDSSRDMGSYTEYYGAVSIRAVPEKDMICGPHWNMAKCFSYSPISLDLKEVVVRMRGY